MRKPLNKHRRILLYFSKICAIALLLFQLEGQARPVLAQYKISARANNISLREVFSLIKKQTGLTVFYGNKILNDKESVSLYFKNAPLEEVLSYLLKDKHIVYEIRRDKVILLKKAVNHPEPNESQRELQTLIRGRVTDEKGKPLTGVSVITKGSFSNVVTTNEQGTYSLQIQSVDSLIFSYIGYATQRISIDGRTEINVKMLPEESVLNEVVVVGYGTQKRVNVTGAVSTVSGEDIAARPVGQTTAALQGMAPGVTVIQRSGKPGADGGDIRIRGVGTMSDAGASPMVLIDGIEGSINNIDPNLIESVSVLKDAASSSIYGSRAANGVILVTTKRGAGDQISVSYNNYLGWQSPTNMPDIVNALDHMLLTNEAYVNTGKSPLYPDELIEAYRAQNGVNSDEYPNTDWQKETLTGSGFQQSHFLTVNAGTKKVRMLASFGLFDQKGIIENSSFKRYTIRNNMDITFSDKLSARIDLQYVNPITKAPSVGVENIFQWVNGLPANQTGINSNGSWGVGWNGNNPISASRDGGINTDKAPFGSINASLNYQPFDWLSAQINYAPKYATTVSKNFKKAIQSYLPDGTPSFQTPALSSLEQKNSQQLYNNMRATLTATKGWNNHHFKWMLGASREDFSTENMKGFRDTYILPNYPVLDAGSAENQEASGGGEEWALQSFFSRLNYDYKEKYLLEVNARYDGSSRFAKGNRYGFFPSLSTGWRITEEPFMQPLKGSALNELKLRASWGRLGNQNIGTYPAVTVIDFGSYTLGGQIINTAALNNLSNANITWETTEEKNIGIDATLFDRLNITADYYYRKTNDILLELDIPLIIGLAKPFQNAGVVENKGWELALSYSNAYDQAFRYNLAFNLSDVRNKVLDMRGVNQTGLNVNREGYPIKALFGYEAQGFFETAEEVANHATQFGDIQPGDIKYKDQNGDGIINESDKIIIGSVIPRLTYSLNANLSYKGFDLGILLQGVGKADGYLYGAGIMPFAVTGSIGGTAREDNKDRWTPENPNATYPRLAFGQTNNEQASSFWLRNAAYLRVKNVQLGYTLPEKLFNGKIKRLRLFANGSNLLTFDDFLQGYDVEAPVGVGNFYPQVKVYTFGLDVAF